MKKIAKLINFPEEMVTAIERYQKEHLLTSFTSAVIQLLKLSLKNERLM